jgi:hypothetical protein
VVNSRWARVARGFLVASFSVFVAMFSHVVAGGSTPGGVGLGLALAFATLASVAVVGRRISLPRLSVSVVLSQFALHLLFSVGAATSSQFEQTSHHGAVTVTTDAVSHGVHMNHSDAGMWLSHAVAATLTIAFLRRGERAVWAVLSAASDRLLVVLIGDLVALPVRTEAPVPSATPASVRTVRDDLGVVFSALRHRGPPTASQSFTLSPA